jgi:hypothetical protein
MTTRLIAALAALNENADDGWLTGGAWNAFSGCDDLRDRVGCDVTELRAALREFYLSQMAETDLLGEIYAHMICERLDREGEQLAEIQRGESSPDDFMDANMVMEAAWYMIGSEKIDNQWEGGEGMTQSQADVWNAAYISGMTALEKF